MTHRREVKFAAWLIAAVVIAGVAYFVGSALKPDEAPYYVFQTEAPAYDQPAAFAGQSQGGFTGFGELDNGDSRTVIAGRVVDMTDKSLTLEAAGGQRVALTLGAKPGIAQIVGGTVSGHSARRQSRGSSRGRVCRYGRFGVGRGPGVAVDETSGAYRVSLITRLTCRRRK